MSLVIGFGNRRVQQRRGAPQKSAPSFARFRIFRAQTAARNAALRPAGVACALIAAGDAIELPSIAAETPFFIVPIDDQVDLAR